MPDYTDYESTPDDNGSGSIPRRFPEGGFKGTWVNECFRHMGAVIRLLGDSAAKLPHDSAGNRMLGTRNGRMGTLAFQDADDVEITGGFFRGRGYCFVGALMDFDGTWAEYVEVYAELFARGWVVCDGRTVTNPYTNATVVLPDYRGRYRRMFVNTSAAGDKFGADTRTTTQNGVHEHNGVTGGTALTTANLPIAAAVIEFTQNGDEDSLNQVGSRVATVHTHTIAEDPGHVHQIDMLPLSVNVITLKRVW
jgi:hypothetical protein